MSATAENTPRPNRAATAALVLADGVVFRGHGLGASGRRVGEVCFNTAMSGYQEVLTDPSYAGQIVTFTFPHIGNVGTNDDDQEAAGPTARGVVLRTAVTPPSNHRARVGFDDWLRATGLVAIAGVDTRRLTRHLREHGAQAAAIEHDPTGAIDIAALGAEAAAWPGLEGMDLAREVSCDAPYVWDDTRWRGNGGHGAQRAPRHHVVAIDYGAKRNILRCLAAAGCRVTVVPATTGAAEIMALAPDGIFLSNGPGDPAATGAYAAPVLRALIAAGPPIFGICLGHQLLALALGARTVKMPFGHRGANHPVKDLATGRVEITSQNHGFVVSADALPAGLRATHISLFDGSLEGLAVAGRPIFSVQYHPEASPGPHDSHHLFARFVALMGRHG